MKEKTLSDKVLVSINDSSLNSLWEKDVKQFIKEVLDEIKRIEKLDTIEMMTETFKLRTFIKQKAGELK